ncbi:MAG TPA: LLM class flavin-dependent oxidoreductase [Candidatus Limnocylindria bacterium]|nr:LLM class flavin-dependent oxidoreductase [Candidatus Limnocylindria bacterium]
MARPIGLDLKHEGRRFAMTGADMISLARSAEEAGFESLWTNEDVGFDAFTVLSAIGQHTSRIRLGTAIVNVFNRSAMQLAMAAATLDELSGGRLMLGLSVGHHPWNDLGHGIPIERPLARLREYVAFLRKALSGEAFTHDGPVFHGVHTRLAFDPLRPSIPIHIAGERPRIVALAGEVADGLIINVVSPEYISDVALPAFRSAAAGAGRDPDALEVTALVTCSLAHDPAVALDQARAMVAHRLRASLKMLDTQPAHRHEEIRHVHGLMQAGDRHAATAAVGEGLARSIVVAGGPTDIDAGLDRYFGAGATRVIAVAYPRGRREVDRLIQTVGPMAARRRRHGATNVQ